MTTPEQGIVKIVDVPLDDLKTYPVVTQSAQEEHIINHIYRIIYRNIIPGVIYEALRNSQPTLRMLLPKISKPLKGGLDHPITQPVPSQSSGAWTDMSGKVFIKRPTNSPQLKFSPTQYVVTQIHYSPEDTKKIMMESPEMAVDIVTQRTMGAYQEMFTDLDKTMLLGSAGSNNSQILGLKDIVDNGTNQSTYGGLSRATYPYLNSQIYNMSSYTSLPTYQVIHLALNSFLNNVNVNQKSPYVGITSFAVFNALTTSMPNIERVNIENPKDILTTRDGAVRTVSVYGVPILPDPNITTNDIIFLNLEKLHFEFIHQSSFKATEGVQSMLPVGQLGYVQAEMIVGQLYSFEPSAHFMAINIPVSQSLL
jgi:hypothetical protein